MTRHPFMGLRLIALLGLGSLGIAPAAAAYELVALGSGAPVRWFSGCVTVWMNPSSPGEIDDAAAQQSLRDAVDAWDSVDCAAVNLRSGGATCFDSVGVSIWPGPQNVVIWRDTPGSWRHADRVVALTSLTYDTLSGEIIDADIELNGEDFVFATNGDPEHHDLTQALTHEVGHLLGLDHSANPEATMYAMSLPGETAKRSLTPDDVTALCTSHPSTRPTGTVCDATTLPPSPASDPWCPEEFSHGCAGAPDLSATTGWPANVPVGLFVASMLLLWTRRRHC